MSDNDEILKAFDDLIAKLEALRPEVEQVVKKPLTLNELCRRDGIQTLTFKAIWDSLNEEDEIIIESSTPWSVPEYETTYMECIKRLRGGSYGHYVYVTGHDALFDLGD